MQARAPLIANKKLIASDEWREPMRDGAAKHRRFIFLVQHGTGSSGSGPQGCKATKRALLARAMRERSGVAEAETARQAVNRARKAKPPAIIYGAPDAH